MTTAQRVVVDPITRIEGHLRIEAETDASGKSTQAYSAGTMVRGIEIILRGRDPRDAWAFAQRICGVCTLVHGIASVRSVEDALHRAVPGYSLPQNAELIRNLMIAAQFVHDHVMHFYHLHALDWVDVVSALKADPRATSTLAQSISGYSKSSPGYFADVQKKVKTFVEQGQLGIFANAYWGHPAYKLPPEANLMAVAHYLEALDFQREIVKIHAIYGGKNPHPNWLVGGVPCAINVDGTGAVGAVNMERLDYVTHVINRTVDFIDQVYVPDLLAIASFYKDWLYGGGLSSQSVMAYGDIPDRANDMSPANLMLPSGVIINGDLGRVHEVDLSDPQQIREFVDHSWYKYPNGMESLHPYEGITDPDFRLGPATKGSKTDIEQLDESAKYSFIKAPRWRGHAVEVGPLARWIIGYAQNKPEFKEPVEATLKKLDLPVPALFSTLGRTAARALECQWAVYKLRYFQNKLMANIRSGDIATANTEKWEPSSWPKDVKGVGFSEAPRGALAHWVHIQDGKIGNYQAVVPTTWNGSPRDPKGNIGAFEAALLNTPMADPAQPLEILRTLHSFDPCLACSTHVMSEDGQEMTAVTVR